MLFYSEILGIIKDSAFSYISTFGLSISLGRLDSVVARKREFVNTWFDCCHIMHLGLLFAEKPFAFKTSLKQIHKWV